jgi:hypothetical protein
MKIEAFSEGKNLDAPEANEDQFLVLPGAGFAVLDGATDNSCRLYDGKRGGWHASRIAMQAVGNFVLDPAEREIRAEHLTERISAAFRASYARHGILEIARGDPAFRFGATLTLAADLGEVFRFVLIGDSGGDRSHPRYAQNLFCSYAGILDQVKQNLRIVILYQHAPFASVGFGGENDFLSIRHRPNAIPDGCISRACGFFFRLGSCRQTRKNLLRVRVNRDRKRALEEPDDGCACGKRAAVAQPQVKLNRRHLCWSLG